MIKRAIRQICYRIFMIGKSEANRLNLLEKKYYYTLGKNSLIDSSAIIQNSQLDKSKIRIGSKSHIKGHLMLFKHGGEISIGDSCFVGQGTNIWSAKKIQIGNRVLISHNVNIHDNISHPLNSKDRHTDFDHIFSTGSFRDQNDLREKEIIIEDDAWIGFNCTILKGVRIGRGAIVGACTVVTENVPNFAVVVGNPARIVKYVE